MFMNRYFLKVKLLAVIRKEGSENRNMALNNGHMQGDMACKCK
jgi:hypothetical protein